MARIRTPVSIVPGSWTPLSTRDLATGHDPAILLVNPVREQFTGLTSKQSTVEAHDLAPWAKPVAVNANQSFEIVRRATRLRSESARAIQISPSDTA